MQILENKRSIFFSVLSGLILTLIFPSFDLEFLAWIAWVPLFFAIQGKSPRQAFLYGLLTGIIFYFFGLHWIINTIIDYGKLPRILGYPILCLLALYLAVYVGIFCFACRKWSHGQPIYFFILSPCLWTFLEFIRSTPLVYGFSWLGLGYSQYKNLLLIQLADITGVYGISALIILVNAGIYMAINAWLGGNNGYGSLSRELGWRAAGVACFFWAACIAYGFFQLNHFKSRAGEPSLKVVLIQGNIKQEIKWLPGHQEEVVEKYKALTLKGVEEHPDLVVWPEAATPFHFTNNAEQSWSLQQQVLQTQTPLLFGAPFFIEKDNRTTMYNSAFLIDGRGKIAGRYDKVHLVPFGEFVPLQNILFFVNKMVEGIGHFGRGKGETIFHLDDHAFGVSICYEITFPDLVRRPVKAGAQFLVNITNDAWFGKSAASYQHFAMAALRAVENRVPVVRAANTGISGEVEATGRIINTTELFVDAVVQTTIMPNRSGPTFYARYGDWFCWACLLVTGLVVLKYDRARQLT